MKVVAEELVGGLTEAGDVVVHDEGDRVQLKADIEAEGATEGGVGDGVEQFEDPPLFGEVAGAPNGAAAVAEPPLTIAPVMPPEILEAATQRVTAATVYTPTAECPVPSDGLGFRPGSMDAIHLAMAGTTRNAHTVGSDAPQSAALAMEFAQDSGFFEKPDGSGSRQQGTYASPTWRGAVMAGGMAAAPPAASDTASASGNGHAIKKLVDLGDFRDLAGEDLVALVEERAGKPLSPAGIIEFAGIQPIPYPNPIELAKLLEGIGFVMRTFRDAKFEDLAAEFFDRCADDVQREHRHSVLVQRLQIIAALCRRSKADSTWRTAMLQVFTFPAPVHMILAHLDSITFEYAAKLFDCGWCLRNGSFNRPRD